ncbi:putative F-box protein [Arabidopsis thaliana]
MNSEENTDSIPIDLILDILSRLPSKSIARSSSRPHLLIAVEQEGEWKFFSLPQPKNYLGKSSLVVAANLHLKFFEDKRPHGCSYASSLIYLPNMTIRKKGDDDLRVICNPSTGQYGYVILPPLLDFKSKPYGKFLGFDPIDKQFKVLIPIFDFDKHQTDHHILTLGAETVGWRKIQSPLRYLPHSNGTICINGILYYLAKINYAMDENVLVCFDVRSENFVFLRLNTYCSSTKLVNYKGKLGMINQEYVDDGGFPLKLSVWVLEDVGKEEWSTYVYTLRDDNKVDQVKYNLSVVGVTASGEIVLVKKTQTLKPFYVLYFNPDKNTLLTVEVKGLHRGLYAVHRIYAFVDHVEDLEFNIMKTTYAAKSKFSQEDRF